MRKVDKTRRHGSMVSFAAAAMLALTAATAQVTTAPTGSTGTINTTATPATPTPPAASDLDASGNYRSEVQACRSGRTAEDEATCLKEARNAQADRKRGLLDNQNAQFRANAMARCNPLTGEDKAACEARMMGYGSVSGSVEGGGLLREVETVVMPPGQGEVTIQPKTSDPVVVVPAK